MQPAEIVCTRMIASTILFICGLNQFPTHRCIYLAGFGVMDGRKHNYKLKKFVLLGI